MEAALKDFEEWMKTLTINEVQYYAVFDPATGKVQGVYPDHSMPDTASKIEVDQEIAQSILEGTTTLDSYVIDIDSGNLEIIELKSLTKIDDVLHRIIDEKWSDVDDADVRLTSDRKNKKITIELSEKFYTTRKIYWNGNTEMCFLFTEYNDPNSLYEIVSLTIDQLFDKRSIEMYLELPEEFSVYTRRIFKNYIIKYEDSRI
jgi:hypothetical protein